jgi:hypothetical protein
VTAWEPAKQEQYQEMRCTSVARGSMYDSRVGITCHFCESREAGRCAARQPSRAGAGRLVAQTPGPLPPACRQRGNRPSPPARPAPDPPLPAPAGRQKKLCGEDDCPRCSRRSVNAECIGKTDCSRCHGATGRFCRACLLLRYGQSIEVRRR